MERNHFSNFGRGSPKEHFLKSGHWPRRHCFKVFLFFTSGGHFVQWSGTILAILMKDRPKNIPMKLFQNHSPVYEEM